MNTKKKTLVLLCVMTLSSFSFLIGKTTANIPMSDTTDWEWGVDKGQNIAYEVVFTIPHMGEIRNILGFNVSHNDYDGENNTLILKQLIYDEYIDSIIESEFSFNYSFSNESHKTYFTEHDGWTEYILTNGFSENVLVELLAPIVVPINTTSNTPNLGYVFLNSSNENAFYNWEAHDGSMSDFGTAYGLTSMPIYNATEHIINITDADRYIYLDYNTSGVLEYAKYSYTYPIFGGWQLEVEMTKIDDVTRLNTLDDSQCTEPSEDQYYEVSVYTIPIEWIKIDTFNIQNESRFYPDHMESIGMNLNPIVNVSGHIYSWNDDVEDWENEDRPWIGHTPLLATNDEQDYSLASRMMSSEKMIDPEDYAVHTISPNEFQFVVDERLGNTSELNGYYVSFVAEHSEEPSSEEIISSVSNSSGTNFTIYYDGDAINQSVEIRITKDDPEEGGGFGQFMEMFLYPIFPVSYDGTDLGNFYRYLLEMMELQFTEMDAGEHYVKLYNSTEPFYLYSEIDTNGHLTNFTFFFAPESNQPPINFQIINVDQSTVLTNTKLYENVHWGVNVGDEIIYNITHCNIDSLENTYGKYTITSIQNDQIDFMDDIEIMASVVRGKYYNWTEHSSGEYWFWNETANYNMRDDDGTPYGEWQIGYETILGAEREDTVLFEGAPIIQVVDATKSGSELFGQGLLYEMGMILGFDIYMLNENNVSIYDSENPSTYINMSWNDEGIVEYYAFNVSMGSDQYIIMEKIDYTDLPNNYFPSVHSLVEVTNGWYAKLKLNFTVEDGFDSLELNWGDGNIKYDEDINVIDHGNGNYTLDEWHAYNETNTFDINVTVVDNNYDSLIYATQVTTYTLIPEIIYEVESGDEMEYVFTNHTEDTSKRIKFIINETYSDIESVDGNTALFNIVNSTYYEWNDGTSDWIQEDWMFGTNIGIGSDGIIYYDYVLPLVFPMGSPSHYVSQFEFLYTQRGIFNDVYTDGTTIVLSVYENDVTTNVTFIVNNDNVVIYLHYLEYDAIETLINFTMAVPLPTIIEGDDLEYRIDTDHQQNVIFDVDVNPLLDNVNVSLLINGSLTDTVPIISGVVSINSLLRTPAPGYYAYSLVVLDNIGRKVLSENISVHVIDVQRITNVDIEIVGWLVYVELNFTADNGTKTWSVNWDDGNIENDTPLKDLGGYEYTYKTLYAYTREDDFNFNFTLIENNKDIVYYTTEIITEDLVNEIEYYADIGEYLLYNYTKKDSSSEEQNYTRYHVLEEVYTMYGNVNMTALNSSITYWNDTSEQWCEYQYTDRLIMFASKGIAFAEVMPFVIPIGLETYFADQIELMYKASGDIYTLEETDTSIIISLIIGTEVINMTIEWNDDNILTLFERIEYDNGILHDFEKYAFVPRPEIQISNMVEYEITDNSTYTIGWQVDAEVIFGNLTYEIYMGDTMIQSSTLVPENGIIIIDVSNKEAIGIYGYTIRVNDGSGRITESDIIIVRVVDEYVPPVEDGLGTWAIVGIVLGSMAGVGGAVGGYFYFKKQKQPSGFFDATSSQQSTATILGKFGSFEDYCEFNPDDPRCDDWL